MATQVRDLDSQLRIFTGVVLDTTLADSDSIEVLNFDDGALEYDGAPTNATLTVYGSYDGVNFEALHTSAGVAVTMTTNSGGAAAGIYRLPAECFSCRFIKFLAPTGDDTCNLLLRKKGSA